VRWRKWFRILHRDVGYVAVALIIAYALSGIAVNHIEDWNPSYRLAERAIDVGPLPAGSLAEMETHVVARLGMDRSTVRGHFQETDQELRVFFDEGQEARVAIATGRGTFKQLVSRAVLFEVNALHLNNLKGVWTYVADLFSLALMFLAITGTVMMKGKHGLAGRGKYFLAAGFAVPIAFIAYLYSS
jgi:hypothetical protein